MKKNLFLGAIAFGFAPALLYAQTVITNVPIIGSMIMPMVSYHSDVGMMHVMMPSEIPQLTPLLISYPTNSFDSADPWFDTLDPGQQGLSFSRRYGFMMDGSSDLLPDGTEMWIRKLSSSPDLQFYSVSSDPDTFTPVFGTDDSTNALYWDGVMYHPVVTAPPGTNEYNATFEVYLINTASGQEVANSSSAPFELDWTDVSDGRPALTLSLESAQNVAVTWPSGTTTNWVLESADSVNVATWTTVTNEPTSLNGQHGVILDRGAAPQFFRMRHVP